MYLLTPSQPLSPIMTNALPTTTESPVQFLRSLFSKDGRVHSRPSTVDPDNYEPYDMETVQAIRNKDVSKLRILLEKGKCFDACNLNGETLLHLACRRSDLKTVKFLLEEAHVNTDVYDDMGRNILHDVCWRPAPDLKLMATLIRILLPETLIAEDCRGHTPFDYVRREHWGVWMRFLQDNQCLIERRFALVSSVQRIDIDCQITLCG
jgi:ankyrin repeat protein